LAEAHNIVVLQPDSLKQDTSIADLSWDIDFYIVVAYGKIIPLSILNISKHWSLNLHWSLLPKYRWASPVQESLKNGDTVTWLTTMYMSAWMDEWDILLQQEIDIDRDDTQLEIFEKFEWFWAELLYKTLFLITEDTIKPIVQDEAQVTYCKKIEKHDGKIDFKNMSAEQIYNLYRAYTPWPWIYSEYFWKKIKIEECSYEVRDINTSTKASGEVLQIDKKTIGIACKNNTFLQLKKVKLEWKKTMNILDFINGNKEFLDYSF
jgi:methionyl-tRNA formyltransferase